MEYQDFSKLFCVLMDSKCISLKDDVSCKTWYAILKGYPALDLERSFWALIKSPDGFPSVGKIIALVEDVKTGNEMAVDVYNYAYKKAKGHFGNGDEWEKPEAFIDTFVKENFQGWKNFWTNAGDQFYRKEFLKVFEMKWPRHLKDEAKALPIEKIRLIG